MEDLSKKKETVGKQAVELLLKKPESTDPIEIERSMQEEYLDYLVECVATHRMIFPSSFFVVVLTKNEKLLPNVFRNYFSARMSCPTPNYDQTVYKYNKELECIEYIWTIPAREVCYYLLHNKHQVVKEEQELLQFVIDFDTGELYKKSLEFNNELPV
jgi:hypothetical protein